MILADGRSIDLHYKSIDNVIVVRGTCVAPVCGYGGKKKHLPILAWRGKKKHLPILAWMVGVN